MGWKKEKNELSMAIFNSNVLVYQRVWDGMLQLWWRPNMSGTAPLGILWGTWFIGTCHWIRNQKHVGFGLKVVDFHRIDGHVDRADGKQIFGSCFQTQPSRVNPAAQHFSCMRPSRQTILRVLIFFGTQKVQVFQSATGVLSEGAGRPWPLRWKSRGIIFQANLGLQR